MEEFKRFDKVTHSVYGYGQVNSVDTELKYVEVVFPFAAGGQVIVTVRPDTLTKTA